MLRCVCSHSVRRSVSCWLIVTAFGMLLSWLTTKAKHFLAMVITVVQFSITASQDHSQ